VVILKWREAQALLAVVSLVKVENVSQKRIFIIDLNCYRILLLKNKFYKTDPRSEAFYNIFFAVANGK
jgi:hypothetical protein